MDVDWDRVGEEGVTFIHKQARLDMVRNQYKHNVTILSMFYTYISVHAAAPPIANILGSGLGQLKSRQNHSFFLQQL